MSLKHAHEYRDPDLARALILRIQQTPTDAIRLMEVCGTHTVSLFRSGIRDVLPESITLLSGPGCPVCVTDQGEIDAFIAVSRLDDVIVATYGDLIRVPGTDSSLQQERAAGRDIRIVYSTMDALEIARHHPDRQVVFLGVGFETTAPTVAAAVMAAREAGIDNFSVFSAHKLVPPALHALLQSPDIRVSGFILPGHVSVIIGVDAYRPVFDEYPLPAVIAGFEPTDMLQAIDMLVKQIAAGRPALENAYPRAVSAEGNIRARQVLNTVFEPVDARWRGIGTIPGSGLCIRDDFAIHDARKRFDLTVPEAEEPKGCACGDILTGTRIPPECPLYKTRCTPAKPVGPCMVSSEGTCAAYYRYHSQ